MWRAGYIRREVTLEKGLLPQFSADCLLIWRGLFALRLAEGRPASVQLKKALTPDSRSAKRHKVKPSRLIHGRAVWSEVIDSRRNERKLRYGKVPPDDKFVNDRFGNIH